MILLLVADIITIILMFGNKRQMLNVIGVLLCTISMFKINSWPGFALVVAIGLLSPVFYLMSRKGKGNSILLWTFYLPVPIHFISREWGFHIQWSWLLLFLSIGIFIRMITEWKTYRTEFIWMTIPFALSVLAVLHKVS